VFDPEKLNDDDLEKLAGEPEGDVPTFRIERVFVDGNTKNDADAD
jgi:hypothetical protein